MESTFIIPKYAFLETLYAQDYTDDRVMRPDHTWSVSFDNLYVEDEVLIQLFNGHQNIILQFWIHCGFIHVCRLLARFILQEQCIHIDKMNLDLINQDKHHKEYDENLFIEVTFSPC